MGRMKMKLMIKSVMNSCLKFVNMDATPFIRFLRSHFGSRPLVGVEVGVYEAVNADRMFRNLNMKYLYLVDLYGKISYNEGDIAGKTIDFSKHYDIAKERLRPYKGCFEFIIDYSDVAVRSIPEKVDFVYIDANHDFQGVFTDIKSYFPIVKYGGVIGGHDYSPRYPGVARAVDMFFQNPSMICFNNDNNEWWRIKG